LKGGFLSQTNDHSHFAFHDSEGQGTAAHQDIISPHAGNVETSALITVKHAVSTMLGRHTFGQQVDSPRLCGRHRGHAPKVIHVEDIINMTNSDVDTLECMEDLNATISHRQGCCN
jgi:hypothetical protein